MDMKVLKQNCMFNHVPFPFKGEMRDLSMEYKEFFGDKTLTNLWKAAEEYGDSGTGKQHKALDDAMTTYKLFRLVERDKKYLENPKPTTIGERVDLSKVFSARHINNPIWRTDWVICAGNIHFQAHE